jgi:hypothetical protein
MLTENANLRARRISARIPSLAAISLFRRRRTSHQLAEVMVIAGAALAVGIDIGRRRRSR